LTALPGLSGDHFAERCLLCCAALAILVSRAAIDWPPSAAYVRAAARRRHDDSRATCLQAHLAARTASNHSTRRADVRITATSSRWYEALAYRQELLSVPLYAAAPASRCASPTNAPQQSTRHLPLAQPAHARPLARLGRPTRSMRLTCRSRAQAAQPRRGRRPSQLVRVALAAHTINRTVRSAACSRAGSADCRCRRSCPRSRPGRAEPERVNNWSGATRAWCFSREEGGFAPMPRSARGRARRRR